jgi:hypothetical protein
MSVNHHTITSYVARVLVALSLMVCAVPVAEAGDDERPAGPYFGQKPPGLEAEIFAPDLISKTGRYEFAISFAPGGQRLLFSTQIGEDRTEILFSQVVGGAWTTPEPVRLSGGTCKGEMEAFFTPDGHRVFFAPFDEALGVRIWQVEFEGNMWGEPSPLAGPIADDPAFFPTAADSGALYYTNVAERRPYRAVEDADGLWQVEPLAIDFGGHVFIAPDESFMLLDARADDSLGHGDIYVVFATDGGGWTTPINLGPSVNSEHSESCPSLSADGRYLFFSRYDEPGGIAQIYWVDARVIDDARQRQLIEQTVHDSIAWALTKDRDRLEQIIAHDDDYFSFHPSGLVGVHGYDEFKRGFELWMDARFAATRTDVRDFRCHLSPARDVAWFSAILDDCYVWDGEPGCWKDTRWTGVLEHRDNRWQIVQMHFSFAADRGEEEAESAE